MAPTKQHDELNGPYYKARRQLLMDYTFMGNLVMHLEPVEDPNCELMWVNGKQIGYNRDALAKLVEESMPTAAGALAQGVLKCALEHHLRRGKRDEKDWNEASDFVVNPMVRDSGLKLPEGSKHDPRFIGKAAEEVYAEIHKDLQPQPQQQQGGGQGQGQQQGQGAGQGSGKQGGKQQGQGAPQQGQQPSPAGTQPQPGQQQAQGGGGGQGNGAAGCEVRDLPGDQGPASPAEKNANRNDWQIAVQQAVNNAKSRGDLPLGLELLAKKILEPVVDWKDELRDFVSTTSREDLSWMRPNRRYLPQRIFLPSLHSERVGEMIFFCDNSGSHVGQRELAAMEAELNKIVEDVDPELVHVVYFDAAVQRTEKYTKEDLPIKLNPKGGGGTDFRPMFKWVEEQGINPVCGVVLTDLEGTFPATEPEYPVLWANTHRPGAQAPFGRTIHVKEMPSG